MFNAQPDGTVISRRSRKKEGKKDHPPSPLPKKEEKVKVIIN